ncbi:hypothetical protein [Kitasatospora sp. NPDC093558]|uniref:hypothetical protein n=1 Tax=Kitasatospora sp. NPDC093558 TaxID=3155201 RepID=UPI003421B2DA
MPDPPKAVADPWQRYLVRVGPAPDPGDGAETLRVAGVSLAAVAADGVRAVAAVLSLTSSSGQASAAASTTTDKLVDSVRRHGGDLWAVFAELGYPVTRPPAAPVPGGGDDWWVGFAASDVSVFAAGICCISVNCPPRC